MMYPSTLPSVSRHLSAAEMHNFVTHRENLIGKLLDESIAEVKALVEEETKLAPTLTKKALGSTNLTSDLDYPRNITTIKQRERRDGVKLVTVEVR